MISRRVGLVTAGVAALALAAAAPAAAAAGPVKSTPVTWTPHLLTSPVDQVVNQLVQCGSTMYAVGTVSNIGQGANTYTRGNGFSFNATTGAMTSWDPKANGNIHSIALSPDCATAYIGGSFTAINGVSASHIAAVDAATGALKTTFKHNAAGGVNTLQFTHGQVIAGGRFLTINGASRNRLASLDPTTGTVTSYANFAISGAYANTGTQVYNSQLNHAGTKMLVEGVFTSFGGQLRQQIVMLDLGSSQATLDGWNSPEFSQQCDKSEAFYVRAAAWSPTDSTVYIATTGFKPASGLGSLNADPRAGLCDAAAAFPATGSGLHHTWVNYTGCDSYYAVAADANDVYVAGHERWANNANGCDFAGPGALSRPGIGSLSPVNGQATAWNPTRSLGHGADDMLVTAAGLWVASDTYTNGMAQKCGGLSNHGGICFFPY
jgi:hypothetical protein